MTALARAGHSSMTQAPGPLATTIPTLTARVHTGPKGIGFASWMPLMCTQREWCVRVCMWWHVCACVYMIAHAYAHVHVCICAHWHMCA